MAVDAKNKGRAKRKRKSTPAFKEFEVDVWITNFNKYEFGFYKHSRNRAKSRQFTSDMDIIADVEENGERTGVLAYREELWDAKERTERRLVLKLFSASLNWKATMDLMVGRSLQLTLGARGLPVTVFSINAEGVDHIVYLERSANKWKGLPEHFSFFIFRDGRPHFYRLRKNMLSISDDYTIYDEKNDVVGELDGAIFTIGGKWFGRMRADHADPLVMTVLKLFCSMLIFNRGCRRHIKFLAREVLTGRLEPKIENHEADLYMNPRRVR